MRFEAAAGPGVRSVGVLRGDLGACGWIQGLDGGDAAQPGDGGGYEAELGGGDVVFDDRRLDCGDDLGALLARGADFGVLGRCDLRFDLCALFEEFGEGHVCDGTTVVGLVGKWARAVMLPRS